MRQLSVSQLAAQLGTGTLLREVVPRLRCNRCGDPPRAVLLSDGQGPSAREVWIVGAARYGHAAEVERLARAQPTSGEPPPCRQSGLP